MGLLTLPKNLITSNGILKHNFETLLGWTLTHGSYELDTTYYKTGVAGIKLTSRLNDTGYMSLDLGSNVLNQWVLTGSSQFRLWMYDFDETKSSSPKLIFKDATGLKSLSIYLYHKTGWNSVVVLPDDFTSSNGMTWNDPIRYMQIQVSPQTGYQASFTFDSFYAFSDCTPAIMIHFDDSDSSTYNIGYVQGMKPYNMPGTFYVRTGKIGDASSVTAAQLLEMQSAGWTIGNHTRNHSNLSTGTYADMLQAIQDGMNDLLSIGITNPYHLAYPGGAYNSTTVQAAIDAGMTTARTVENGLTTGMYQVYQPWTRLHKLPRYFQAQNTVSLETAKAAVDTLVEKKLIGVLLFHRIASNPSTYDWYTDRFLDLMAYINSLNIPCITIDTAYKLLSEQQTITVNWDTESSTTASKCLVCPCSPSAWMWCSTAFIKMKQSQMLGRR